MNKDKLLAQLENHKVSYEVGLASMALFTAISFQDEEGKSIQFVFSKYKEKYSNSSVKLKN